MAQAVVHPFLAAMRLPDRVAFSVSGVDVYWYGLFLAVGILAAILLSQRSAKTKGLPRDTAVDVCLISIPLGVVCARILYVLMFLPYFQVDPISVLYVWDGGLSIYGAVFGALLGVAIYSLVKKLPILSVTDCIVPGLVLAQGFAKWGDFFNQEGYGPQVAAAWEKWFPFAVLIERTDSIHYALFFYEFVWCVLVFCFLWFVLRRSSSRPGTETLWYLVLYCPIHALFEFLRADPIYLFANVPTATFISGVLFLLALAALIVRSFIKPKATQAVADDAAATAPVLPVEASESAESIACDAGSIDEALHASSEPMTDTPAETDDQAEGQTCADAAEATDADTSPSETDAPDESNLTNPERKED